MKAIDNITHEIRMVVSSRIDVFAVSLMRMASIYSCKRAEFHTVALACFLY